jgi:hypothetical protein
MAQHAMFLDPSLPRAREPAILAQTSPVPRDFRLNTTLGKGINSS